MLDLDDESDLALLHAGNVKESLYLEFKASAAIDKKDDAKKLEMARDVSAFANSAGGQIIYGMAEKNHEPSGLDVGIDPKSYPTIWFEQILQQHITPNIHGLDIHHVPLSNGNVAVVITIPPTNGDPHQVSDGKYFRRNNFNRISMDHYEIKAMFYRTTTPELFVDFTLSRGDNTAINYNSGDELSQPVGIGVVLGNRSVQPAFHTVIQIGVHTSLTLMQTEDWNLTGMKGEGSAARRWLSRSLSSPPNLPVFKEIDQTLPSILIRFHSRLLVGAHRLQLDVKIVTPGFVNEEEWTLHQEGQHLRMLRPNHPLTR